MRNIFKLTFCVIVVTTIAVMYFQAFRQFREGDRRTAALRQLTAEMIDKIEVYGDYYGYTRLEVPNVNSPASKALFAEAMHDLASYSPNHDRNTQDFFIRLSTTAGEKMEFNVWLKPAVRGTAFMYMTERSNQGGRVSTRNLGSRKSSGLYRWLDGHKLTK